VANPTPPAPLVHADEAEHRRLIAIRANSNIDERGVFPPVVTFATPGDLSVAYTTQLGSYYRIGSFAFVTVGVTCSTFTHTTASGNFQITGLPYVCADEPIFIGPAFASNLTFGAGKSMLTCQIPANQSFLTLVLSGSGVSAVVATTANATSGSAISVRASIAYSIA